MLNPEITAKIDKYLRQWLNPLPPYLTSILYSNARKLFIQALADSKPNRINLPIENRRKIWGLEFNSALFNAAGMFKKGEGYEASFLQGAGAWLCGSTTLNPRAGNFKIGIQHPFMPYSFSQAASNWMGLPNEGHYRVAQRMSRIQKQKGCPIGASISPDPGLNVLDSANYVIEGINLYQAAGCDFLEINESCPNVQHDESLDLASGLDKHLIDRIMLISEKYIKKRNHFLPLILKFSVDTSPERLPALLELIISAGFDGVNFGNTSVDYKHVSSFLHSNDQKNFNFFISKFGGGVSGFPLKEKSLNLCKYTSEYLKQNKPKHEFHIIRTGGIFSTKDIQDSDEAGVSLNQWFTGYFEGFSNHGHKVYQEIFKK